MTIGGQPHVAGIHNFIPGSNAYAEGSNADAVLVGIEAAKAGPWVFQSSTKPVHRITNVKPGLSYVQNGRICIAARQHFYRCGKIKSSSVNARGDQPGALLTNDVVKWEYFRPGDVTSQSFGGSSGGPIYSYGLAQGIHKGSARQFLPAGNRTRMTMYASKIHHVETLLNVTVLTG